jgi:hypothetical protein
LGFSSFLTFSSPRQSFLLRSLVLLLQP